MGLRGRGRGRACARPRGGARRRRCGCGSGCGSGCGGGGRGAVSGAATGVREQAPGNTAATERCSQTHTHTHTHGSSRCLALHPPGQGGREGASAAAFPKCGTALPPPPPSAGPAALPPRRGQGGELGGLPQPRGSGGGGAVPGARRDTIPPDPRDSPRLAARTHGRPGTAHRRSALPLPTEMRN